jgi:hypothetical protein
MKKNKENRKDEGAELIAATQELHDLLRDVTDLEQLGITDPVEKAAIKKRLGRIGRLLDEMLKS